MSVRLKEVEKSRQEEALQIQDRATSVINDLKNELETLKGGQYIVHGYVHLIIVRK